ncbi:MAG: YfiR family protein [Chitinophagaceae bacterium]
MKKSGDLFFSAMKHPFKRCWLIPGGYNFLFLLFIFLVQAFSPAEAQHESDYAVHANIIYHFTKYIDWPDNKKSGDFIIGIIGDTPLFDELTKNVVNKTVGYQRIVIKKISVSDALSNCHILFIADEESGSMKKIVSRTEGAPVLLVTETEGLAQKGGCINFCIVSDHLKLEINKNNIVERDLGIASELLQLGKIVK